MLNCGRSVGWCLMVAMSVSVAVGCGGGGASDDKATAKVTGKVTHNGSVVSGGEVVFSPVAEAGAKGPPGQAGRGAIKSDGTFVVTTYKDGDGAVIGQHRIMYMPGATPAATHDEQGKPAAEQKAPAKLVPSKDTVAVAKGDNTINIELVEEGAK